MFGFIHATSCGVVCSAPEIKETQEGKLVANFSIAMNQDKENVNFINCRAYGPLVSFVENNIRKGIQVTVIGKLEQVKAKQSEKTYLRQTVEHIFLGYLKNPENKEGVENTYEDGIGI